MRCLSAVQDVQRYRQAFAAPGTATAGVNYYRWLVGWVGGLNSAYSAKTSTYMSHPQWQEQLQGYPTAASSLAGRGWCEARPVGTKMTRMQKAAESAHLHSMQGSFGLWSPRWQPQAAQVTLSAQLLEDLLGNY